MTKEKVGRPLKSNRRAFTRDGIAIIGHTWLYGNTDRGYSIKSGGSKPRYEPEAYIWDNGFVVHRAEYQIEEVARLHAYQDMKRRRWNLEPVSKEQVDVEEEDIDTKVKPKKGIYMAEGARILTTKYSLGKWYTIKPKDRPFAGDVITIDGIQYTYDAPNPVSLDRTKKCKYCPADFMWICKSPQMIINKDNPKERGFILKTFYSCPHCGTIYFSEDEFKPNREQKGQRHIADFVGRSKPKKVFTGKPETFHKTFYFSDGRPVKIKFFRKTKYDTWKFHQVQAPRGVHVEKHETEQTDKDKAIKYVIDNWGLYEKPPKQPDYKRMRIILDTIRDIEKAAPDGNASIGAIVKEAEKKGFDRDETMKGLAILKRHGEIYEPIHGKYRITEY